MSLQNERAAEVLNRLHSAANSQKAGLVAAGLSMIRDKLFRRPGSQNAEVERIKDLYVPVTRKQGEFLYIVARSCGAKRIVEFGTSFGISTIYLAAAVTDNGGGVVFGTELEPLKVRAAQGNIDEAAFTSVVDILEGDALQTLRSVDGPIDMVLLDGYKNGYLDVLKMLAPRLRPGSVVIADNLFTFRHALKPYRQFVRDPNNGFHSVTLMLGDGTEYSVRL